MAYEWCQRLGDMRTLEWDRYTLGYSGLHLEQSKRRAEVFLPISEDLMACYKISMKTLAFKGT